MTTLVSNKTEDGVNVEHRRNSSNGGRFWITGPTEELVSKRAALVIANVHPFRSPFLESLAPTEPGVWRAVVRYFTND